MRRLLVPACVVGVLVAAGSAAAMLTPIQRTFGNLTIPLVRTGKVTPPARQLRGRTRVIVTLGLPPLAAAQADRSLFGIGPRRKLSVTSASSRSYLARIDSAQRRAIASLRRAIPQATIDRRFQILLDGFTVSLPVRRLAALDRLGFVHKVYPSLRYNLELNRAPSIIGAPAFRAATGASGAGIKVAVVDDGIDWRHPFLDPAGLSYPPGFPKGTAGFTTPKVIVAKAFFGRNSTSEARLPLDEGHSFHGTFVSGVIAGDEGTTAPQSAPPPQCQLGSGGCHPTVTGLSGVAPRAWLGNYRVFSAVDPFGNCCSADTPEIIAAFEAAVKDGMDVINFSGGGTQSDPSTDALIEAVSNVVKAGVVPVISAGNDRDLFGLGTVGSPSTAPDAISVAAVTNSHVFGPALSLVSPDVGALKQLPFSPAGGDVPTTWATTPQALVDVGTVTGTDGKAVDRHLCGSTLPAGSLRGAIALASRGGCSFDAKANAAAAASAQGIILADDQPGDPSPIIIRLVLPGGMISDLDGARLRAALAGSGGRGTILVGRDQVEIGTNWPGVPTSFSSAGLTAFGHQLKPDLSAPGAQIISSTLSEFAGDPYAVLDGTSFSAPHVSGAAALLLQRHPSWTPPQIKSALMSTAGPTFADTARTTEAPVYLEGAGLANVSAADNPMLFTVPQSLSFGDLKISTGAASRPLLVTVSDGGGGAGTWQVEVQAQTASAGVSIDVPGAITIGPGGQTTLQVVARASAGATAGDQFGFVVLRRGNVTRRIPYGFSVIRPQLAGAEVIPLKRVQRGDTRTGVDRVHFYRWPTAPFGVLGFFGLDPTTPEDGKEKVYAIDIKQKAVNFGAVVVNPALSIRASIESLLSANAPIHPWVLGSLDENDLQGFAAIPVNVNGSLPDFIFSIGAAAAELVPPGRYYVVVDSGHDPFTGRSLAGPYVLRSWVNDVKPPRIRLLTTHVSAGHPSIAARITDTQSGVDPLALVLSFKNRQIGALLYDPATGIAVFSIPKEVHALEAGPEFMRLIASDFQETKNVNTEGTNPLPNTNFEGVRVNVVDRPAVTWLVPNKGACVSGRAQLEIVASSPSPISSVGFFDGEHQIARVTKSVAGVYQARWQAGSAKRRTHTLTAVASDTAGREARASRTVRICK